MTTQKSNPLIELMATFGVALSIIQDTPAFTEVDAGDGRRRFVTAAGLTTHLFNIANRKNTPDLTDGDWCDIYAAVRETTNLR